MQCHVLSIYTTVPVEGSYSSETIESMPPYFKPLRRKLGVLTLVMACAICGFWTRSFTVVDILAIGKRKSSYSILSYNGRVGWHHDLRTLVYGDSQRNQNQIEFFQL